MNPEIDREELLQNETHGFDEPYDDLFGADGRLVEVEPLIDLRDE